jgi:hypothetical protein
MITNLQKQRDAWATFNDALKILGDQGMDNLVDSLKEGGIAAVDQAVEFSQNTAKAVEANMLLSPIADEEMRRVQRALDGVDTNDINAVLVALQNEFGYTVTDAQQVVRELGILDGTYVEAGIRVTWDVEDMPSHLPPNWQPRWTPGQPLEPFHGGGIVGGSRFGSEEVLAVLQKGEGVIDKQTMTQGLPMSGGGSVTNVYIEGNLFGAATVEDLVDLLESGKREYEMRQ